MQKLSVLESREIYKSKVISLVEEKVQKPDGGSYTHLSVKHPGAVVIIPQESDGSLLVLEQYRHSVRDTLLEFPAGTINVGEDPKFCAERELEEEVGKKASDWIDLGTLYPAPGFCNERQFIYFARNLAEGVSNLDEDEILNVRRMTISEVEDAIQNGAMIDGKSIATFCRARLKGLV